MARPRWMRWRLPRLFLKILALMHFPRVDKGDAYVVCARGGHLLKSSIPFLFFGEVIPMLWDCWPSTWDKLERDLRLMKCRLCFVTASDAAKEMAKRLPEVRFVHVPEGVALSDYTVGKALSERAIDVYELGAKHEYFHKKLMDGNGMERWNWVFGINKRKKGLTSVFEDWNTFTSKVAEAKVLVSFPMCMRNPVANGQVATLTIRYWEGMLSRCVIVGHCPQELIDIVGYNPVIEADFVDPCRQMDHILTHIADYQEMVDRNYAAARRHAPWSARIDGVFEALQMYDLGK